MIEYLGGWGYLVPILLVVIGLLLVFIKDRLLVLCLIACSIITTICINIMAYPLGLVDPLRLRNIFIFELFYENTVNQVIFCSASIVILIVFWALFIIRRAHSKCFSVSLFAIVIGQVLLVFDIPTSGYLMLICGSISVLVLLFIYINPPGSSRAVSSPLIYRWIFIALLLIVFGLGIFFRLYRLTEIPNGLCDDAATHGIFASKFADGLILPQIYYGIKEGAFMVFAGYVFKLFGSSYFNLRLSASILGMLNLIVFYLLLRVIFTRWFALAGTFIMSVYSFHVTFSRFGLRIIMIPLCVTIFLFFFFKAINTQRLIYFILSGLSLPLGLYVYTGYKFVPFLGLLSFIIVIVLKGNFLRASWWKLILMFIAIAAVVYPIAANYYFNPNTDMHFFSWREKEQTVLGRKDMLDSLVDNLLIILKNFHYRMHPGPWYRHKGGIMDPVLAVLFTIGLIYCLRYLLRWENAILFSWLVIPLAFASLLTAVEPRRLAFIIPIIIILAVQGLRLIISIYPRLQRLPGVLILIVVLLFMGYLEYQTLFVEIANCRFWPEMEFRDLISNRIAENYKDHVIFVPGEHLKHAQATFLLYNQAKTDEYKRNVHLIHQFGQILPFTPDIDMDVLLISDARSDFDSFFYSLKALYPGAQIESLKDTRGKVSLKIAYIPLTDIVNTFGLLRKALTENGITTQRSTKIDLAGLSGDALRSKVVWEGSLFSPGECIMELNARLAGELEVSIDNYRYQVSAPTAADSLKLSHPLSYGLHDIRLVYEFSQEAADCQVTILGDELGKRIDLMSMLYTFPASHSELRAAPVKRYDCDFVHLASTSRLNVDNRPCNIGDFLVDDQGYIWFADKHSLNVHKINMEGDFLDRIRSQTDPEGSFSPDFQIGMDDDGFLRISDPFKRRVAIVDPTTKEEKVIQTPFIPLRNSIAVSSDGNSVVSYPHMRCIRTFDKNGKVIKELALCGKVDSVRLFKPFTLAFNKVDELYIFDLGNNHLITLDEDYKVRSYFYAGANMNEVFHIAVDWDGWIYLVSEVNWKVYVFDGEGNLVVTERFPGAYFSAPGARHLVNLRINHHLRRIYVCFNSRFIAEFKKVCR